MTNLSARLPANNGTVSTTPPARTAPTDRGERLGTFERGDSEELRVCWDEFKGHPYLSLRVWTRGTDGQWWPDKGRGCSVRVRELEGSAAVLARAVELAAVASPAGGNSGDR